jgi:pyridoxal phosphate enzyme (YggS family)
MVCSVTDLKENLNKIHEEIEKVGVDFKSVQIIAVTKWQPYQKVKTVVDLGLQSLGVNYAQEGKTLMAEIKRDFPEKNLDWHFIGHIQSRKVKDLVDYHSIDSLDRIEIAESLNQKLLLSGRTLSALLEVNIGREPQKSGVLPEQVLPFLETCQAFSQIHLQGLMTMPPAVDLKERGKYFQATRSLYDNVAKEFSLSVLSMGTSDDYPIAVSEGANQIRLGTCLFGARPQR